MSLSPSKPCPCTSGHPYATCCGPFHQGKLPNTALQLMRSRYAAYALGLPEYIIKTTHPANPDFRRDSATWAEEILAFCKQTEFRGLEILDVQEKGSTATVTFIAHLVQNHHDVSFTEKSLFERVDGRWLYRAAENAKPAI